jgi:hypothetical protein
MNQKSSLPQLSRFVSRVLTADTLEEKERDREAQPTFRIADRDAA